MVVCSLQYMHAGGREVDVQSSVYHNDVLKSLTLNINIVIDIPRCKEDCKMFVQKLQSLPTGRSVEPILG
jgi:hypothetical protein